MFTNVKSTIRHITPADIRGRQLLKVVYVVLEPQYQSAISAAVNAINDHNPKVAIEISGYLLEELRDPENYAGLERDIQTANIFIASLIFIEDLAEKVVAAVAPHRDNLDVAVVFPSMPAVMRLSFTSGVRPTASSVRARAAPRAAPSAAPAGACRPAGAA